MPKTHSTAAAKQIHKGEVRTVIDQKNPLPRGVSTVFSLMIGELSSRYISCVSLSLAGETPTIVFSISERSATVVSAHGAAAGAFSTTVASVAGASDDCCAPWKLPVIGKARVALLSADTAVSPVLTALVFIAPVDAAAAAGAILRDAAGISALDGVVKSPSALPFASSVSALPLSLSRLDASAAVPLSEALPFAPWLLPSGL